MQKAVNIILTLMSPTPSPPPAVLLPRARHLPHALCHCQLDLRKIGKEMRFGVIYFKTRGSDSSEIQTGFVQKPLNISPQLLCIFFAM